MICDGEDGIVSIGGGKSSDEIKCYDLEGACIFRGFNVVYGGLRVRSDF